MKKILIITSSYDTTVDYLIDKFRENAEFFRFNTDLLYDYNIGITEKNGWNIKNEHWEIVQRQIDAIYFRKPSYPNISNYDLKYHKMMQKDILTFIQGVAEVFNGRCLSKPSILNRADNKMYQLSLAYEVGFNIPQTMISNSSDFAFDFCSQVKSIVKPLSMGKVYSEGKVGIIQTNLVDHSCNFNGLEVSPSYFQEYVEKDFEVRVTIIDNNVFAVKIETTNKVDWRKFDSKNTYSIISLPDEICAKCLFMLDRLNLKFGAFDFIVNKNKYYFLEVNANGQWYWLEEALNLNISDCIFNYLAEVEI